MDDINLLDNKIIKQHIKKVEDLNNLYQYLVEKSKESGYKGDAKNILKKWGD